MADIVSNYPTLVSAVVNATEDDSAEFRAFIPTAIGLAEDRMARELDAQLLIVTATVSATQGTRLVNKPSGYRMGHEVLFTTSGGSQKNLRKRTRGYLNVYWPTFTNTAEPVYYADMDASTIALAPTPDFDAQVIFTYEKKPDYLTAANSVNLFTEFFPNALYYGTMAEMAKFAKQWDQVQLWDANFMEAMQAANNEGRRARRDGNEPLTNPENVENTFNGEN